MNSSRALVMNPAAAGTTPSAPTALARAPGATKHAAAMPKVVAEPPKAMNTGALCSVVSCMSSAVSQSFGELAGGGKLGTDMSDTVMVIMYRWRWLDRKGWVVVVVRKVEGKKRHRSIKF